MIQAKLEEERMERVKAEEEAAAKLRAVREKEEAAAAAVRAEREREEAAAAKMRAEREAHEKEAAKAKAQREKEEADAVAAKAKREKVSLNSFLMTFAFCQYSTTWRYCLSPAVSIGPKIQNKIKQNKINIDNIFYCGPSEYSFNLPYASRRMQRLRLRVRKPKRKRA